MVKLLLRKCLQGLMMILIVSAVTFALLGFAGGDALTQLRDNPQISKVTIERLRSIFQTASVRDLLNSPNATLNYLCVFFR